MSMRLALAIGLVAIPGTALAINTAPLAQPAEPEVISNPNPASFQVYGMASKPKTVKDDTVEGGRALPVAVSGSGDPWSSGVNVPIIKGVKAGDRIDIYFYAKLAEGGPATARIANAQLQLASAPYTRIFGEGVDVTPQWKLFHVSGKADKDYGKGALNAAFHLNTGKHTVVLGAVAVLNNGQ